MLWVGNTFFKMLWVSNIKVVGGWDNGRGKIDFFDSDPVVTM
jgi:hypothetical protein